MDSVINFTWTGAPGQVLLHRCPPRPGNPPGPGFFRGTPPKFFVECILNFFWVFLFKNGFLLRVQFVYSLNVNI